MTPSDIIQAWKDPNYRMGLSATQRAKLPAHPAGMIELPEPTLHAAWPQQGFRVKSGLRAGAPTANCTQQGQTCGGNHNETLVRVQTDRALHTAKTRLLAPMATISGRTT